MKKFGFGVLALMLLALLVSCDDMESSTTKNTRANEKIAQAAIQSVKIPVPENYLERKTVAAWFENWDKPGKISYLYIFTFNECIGYFVIDGKPISNRSYLTPEVAYYLQGAVLPTPSLDGTYGEDLPGIRFKTANGTWMEFGGMSFTYIYADNPIPNLSRINLTPKE